MKNSKSSPPRLILLIALLIAVSVSIYSNTFFHQFLYDDHQTILENELIKNWKNLPLILESDYFKLSGEQSFRPLVTLTYFLDYSFWKLNPFGYHLTNLLIHTLNGLLFFFLLRLILHEDNFALFSSILFIVHPLVTEAVNCVSFREDLMVLGFYLLSFFLYLKGRKYLFQSLKGALFYFFSTFSFILALLTKEMAITLPLVLLLYELIFPDSGKGKPRTRFFWLYPHFLILGIFLALRFTVLFQRPEIDYEVVSLSVRLLTMSRVMLTYFKLFVWPKALSAEYLFPLVFSLREPQIFFTFAGVVLIIIVPIAVSLSFSRKTLFAFLWFFLSFLPIVNIYPLKNMAAERYLYLPVAVFAILLGTTLTAVFPRLSGRARKGAGTALLLILGLFSLRTINRNLDWQDEFNFYQKTLASCPQSSRFHYNVGVYYMEQQRFEPAVKELNACLSLAPDDYQAFNCLGIIYAQTGKSDQALDCLWKALRLKPNYGSAALNLGNLYYREGRLKEAIRPYQVALAQAPSDSMIMGNLIDIYLRLEMRKEAIYLLEVWLRRNPGDFRAHQHLGNLYLKEGAYRRAAGEFEKVLRQSPEEPLTLNNLGIVYYCMKDFDRAREYWERALAAKPDLLHAQKNLQTLEEKKDTPPAIVELETVTSPE